MSESTNPQLSVGVRSDWLAGFLRADQIRTDTLLGLVSHWGDEDARDAVIAALDTLAEALQGPREGELDALVEAVEDAAAMDEAHVPVRLVEAERLRSELDELIVTLSRFNPARRPAVIGRRAS